MGTNRDNFKAIGYALLGALISGVALILQVVWFPVRVIADIVTGLLTLLLTTGNALALKAVVLVNQGNAPSRESKTARTRMCAAPGCGRMTLEELCEEHAGLVFSNAN